jgi:hypothetical protein
MELRDILLDERPVIVLRFADESGCEVRLEELPTR